MASLENVSANLNYGEDDVSLWKWDGEYKNLFSTKETWSIIRAKKGICGWAGCVWFSQYTPKFAFRTWLAVQNRLLTMDIVVTWNHEIDATCVLCKGAGESRSHIFFECHYSEQVWRYIPKGILRDTYTSSWGEIMRMVTNGAREKLSLFCLRYAFQAVIYAIWSEHNRIIHGEKLTHVQVIQKMVEKGIRNKITLVRRKGCKGMERTMQFCFETRE